MYNGYELILGIKNIRNYIDCIGNGDVIFKKKKVRDGLIVLFLNNL